MTTRETKDGQALAALEILALTAGQRFMLDDSLQSVVYVAVRKRMRMLLGEAASKSKGSRGRKRRHGR